MQKSMPIRGEEAPLKTSKEQMAPPSEEGRPKTAPSADDVMRKDESNPKDELGEVKEVKEVKEEKVESKPKKHRPFVRVCPYLADDSGDEDGGGDVDDDEDAPDPCEENQCKKGKCIPVDDDNYECKCRSGWSGRFCDQGE